jgi:hypothetical protein
MNADSAEKVIKKPRRWTRFLPLIFAVVFGVYGLVVLLMIGPILKNKTVEVQDMQNSSDFNNANSEKRRMSNDEYRENARRVGQTQLDKWREAKMPNGILESDPSRAGAQTRKKIADYEAAIQDLGEDSAEIEGTVAWGLKAAIERLKSDMPE